MPATRELVVKQLLLKATNCVEVRTTVQQDTTQRKWSENLGKIRTSKVVFALVGCFLRKDLSLSSRRVVSLILFPSSYFLVLNLVLYLFPSSYFLLLLISFFFLFPSSYISFFLYFLLLISCHSHCLITTSCYNNLIDDTNYSRTVR